MAAIALPNVEWYVDREARARGEPGIYLSFISSLAGALRARGDAVDPVWLMGASGWAFRILMNEALCTSATSMFSFVEVLPDSVRNAGYDCTYVSRLWHEDAVRAQRQAEAHDAIAAGLARGTPAIVWDLIIPEWGLVTGLDDDTQTYEVLGCCQTAVNPADAVGARHHRPGWCESHRPVKSHLPYSEIGDREIKILSVTVLGEPNGRPHGEAVRHALEIAVHHAEGGEWDDRPRYENGLAAYTQWIRALNKQDASGWEQAEYHAGHWAGARCYAREFMRRESESTPALRPAADAYGKVAERLLAIWRAFCAESYPTGDRREELIELLGEARRYEGEAIAAIKRHLA